MSFKSGCSNVCGWFSVVGAFTYGVLAIMLFRRNQPVIEHKFKIEFENEELIDATMGKMITMVFIMIASSLLCFISSVVFARKDLQDEEAQKESLEKQYMLIFRDELIKEGKKTKDEKMLEAL